ncbi:MAG TPA: accessory factor UbiK family protein [Alphaproteobacteria bacterium]|nr:accessory factor UbiK family protein [Alphaproteobacteria bacterium]
MSRRDDLLGRLGKMGSEALISAANLKRELEAQGLDRLEHLAKRLKLVRREEFEALQASIKQLRTAQENLSARLDRLEGKSGQAPRRAKKIPTAADKKRN